jgi:hypothetical protein
MQPSEVGAGPPLGAKASRPTNGLLLKQQIFKIQARIWDPVYLNQAVCTGTSVYIPISVPPEDFLYVPVRTSGFLPTYDIVGQTYDIV